MPAMMTAKVRSVQMMTPHHTNAFLRPSLADRDEGSFEFEGIGLGSITTFGLEDLTVCWFWFLWETSYLGLQVGSCDSSFGFSASQDW